MRFLTILMVTGALMAQAPAFEPLADSKELMNAMIIPASNDLFNAGLDSEPDDAAWAELRNQALILGEAANLLVTPGRAPAAESSQPDWAAASKLMLEASKAALTAIEKKDLDGLTLDAADKILASCEACHSKYMN